MLTALIIAGSCVAIAIVFLWIFPGQDPFDDF